MAKDLETIANWNDFSEKTQENIKISKTSGLDAVGLFMSNKYNAHELLSFFQVLADPNLNSQYLTKENWQFKNLLRVREIASHIAPYTADGKYSCYALKAINSSDNIQFPLVTNYSTSNVYLGEKQSPRYEKLKNLFSEKLDKKIVESNFSTNESYYKETRKAYEIYSKLSLNSKYVLNEFDKIVLFANITSHELMDEFVLNNKAKSTEIISTLNKDELDITLSITNQILTLAIMRTIDIGNSEIAHNIDEALKLQISNNLAKISSKGSNIPKAVVSFVTPCINNVVNKLDFSLDRTIENMKNMGFSYKKQPKTVFEAIFNAGNLEKTYNVEQASAKKKKVLHALTGPALLAGKTYLAEFLPGLIDQEILTKKDKEKFNMQIATPVASLQCILKKKNKEQHLVPVIIGFDEEKRKIINAVVSRFDEQREEDFGKTTKQRLNNVLNEKYNDYNDTDKTKRNGTLIRKMVDEQIKKASKASKDNEQNI